MTTRKWLLLTAVIVVGRVAYFGWRFVQPQALPDGFASSNGRIDAVEIDVATKTAPLEIMASKL
jgi:HlyD family secretion protein